ncbi:MAG: ATP-binding protein [Bacteroidota bacterium]
MKFTGYALLLIIVTGVLSGCDKKNTHQHPHDLSPAQKTRMDSVIKLDSLVIATKSSDNRQAHRYADLALSLASRMNYAEALTRASLVKGVAFFNHNNDSSFLYYSKALKFATDNDVEDIKPTIFYNLAMIYGSAYNLKMEVIYLDSSITVAQRNRDYRMLSNALNALGNLKFNLLDTFGARKMYDSACGIASRHGLPGQTGIALASLSRFARDPAVSSAMKKKAISVLLKKAGNEEEIASILNNLGMQSPDPDTAIRYYQAAIKLALSGKYTEVAIAAYNNLAYSYLDKKDVGSAAGCLVRDAIPLAENTGNLDWLASLYDTYKDVLVAGGKTAAALEYEQKALKTRVKADQQQAAGQVRLLATLLDVRSKELRLQKNEKELQQKEDKIRLIIFWFSAFLLILLAATLAVALRMQRIRIRYQNSLITSAKKLIAIEEDMKGRIAMELHDLTSPFYYTMLRQIESAGITDTSIARDLTANVSDMAKNIRAISHRMSNDFIEQLTIRELVNGLCEDMKRTSAVTIRCVMGNEDFNLSKEETLHIYRIVQELLTNALKYVPSGEILLSLSVESGVFIILYQDTGSGFDMNLVSRHGLGIMNIFERARLINGKAILDTAPGKGTRWNVIIPQNLETKERTENMSI